jgi:hemerythrin
MRAPAEAPAFDDRLLVGHAAMDREHRTFAHDLHTLQHVDDAGFAAALQQLAEHLRAHFALEERLIEEHQFPPGACHAEEHHKVLASLDEVQALVAQGDIGIGRELAAALADWFPGHAENMDGALAIWVSRKTHGGAPVVLRRDLHHHHANATA